jgi:hypothetical protein
MHWETPCYPTRRFQSHQQQQCQSHRLQPADLPLHPGVGARHAVGIDDGREQTLNIATAEYSWEWSENVLRGAAIRVTSPIKLAAGKHTLKLRPLDPALRSTRLPSIRAACSPLIWSLRKRSLRDKLDSLNDSTK